MKVYLIRHAQSQYNVGEAALQQELGPDYKKTERYVTYKFCPELMDVSITENGLKQCEDARKNMEGIHVDVVIVSPLRRALETCWEIFKDHPSKPQIVVNPLFKQIMESNCDIGNRLEEAMKDYPTFDFSNIENPKSWYLDTLLNPTSKKDALEHMAPLSEEDLKCSQKLALKFLEFLKHYHGKNMVPDSEEDMKARHLLQLEHLKNTYKDKVVAVVSHSENLKHYIGWKIKNCEIKEYTIQE